MKAAAGIRLYAKGSGTSGCLLTGTLDDQAQFIELKLPGSVLKDIKLSGLFALAITLAQPGQQGAGQQKVLRWGNFNDKLILKPQTLALKYKVEGIACGWNHGLIKIGCGRLLGIGDNKYGQLNPSNALVFFDEPVAVQEAGAKVGVIGAGFRQSYWTYQDCKQIVGCGQSKHGELGVIAKKQLLGSTRLVSSQQIQGKFMKISCGKKHILAMTNLGEAFGLGSNGHGCLSDSQNADQFLQLTLVGNSIRDIACGWTHSLFLDHQGRIRSRGRNNFGQLGRGPQSPTVQISQRCRQVESGTQFSFAVGQSGTLYGWGWNQHMNIVNQPHTHTIALPVPVPVPPNCNTLQCVTHPAITVLQVEQID